MHYYVVSYVKRKYYGKDEISVGFRTYCEFTGINPEVGWNMDFWLSQLIDGHEIHVINSNHDELLDQYLVSEEIYKDKDSDYYQIKLDE